MFGDNLDRIVKSIEKNYEADEIFFTKPGRRFPSRLAVKSVGCCSRAISATRC